MHESTPGRFCTISFLGQTSLDFRTGHKFYNSIDCLASLVKPASQPGKITSVVKNAHFFTGKREKGKGNGIDKKKEKLMGKSNLERVFKL